MISASSFCLGHNRAGKEKGNNAEWYSEMV